MAPKASNAFQEVLKALDKATDEEVHRIFGAIMVLRGITPPAPPATGGTRQAPPVGEHISLAVPGTDGGRPKSFTEVLREKTPDSNPQRILTYAYYLDKYGNKQRFSREDLNEVYTQGRLTPDPNFSRDLGRLVQAGLIHESGANSYITSTGIEAIESNYATMKPGPKKGVGRKVAAKGKPAKK